MFIMDYSISVFKEHQEMVFLVPRVHLGSTSIIRGQLFQRVPTCQKPNERYFQISVLYFTINFDFG